MRETHTHKGHCPACGAIHAVSTNETLVAKHGYNTYWGYFDNICDGADHTPLELDKTFTEKFIGKLEEFIIKTGDEITNFTGVKGVNCRFNIGGETKKIEAIPSGSPSASMVGRFRHRYKVEYIPVDEIADVINNHRYVYGSAYKEWVYDKYTEEEIIERANILWIKNKKADIKGAKEHIEFLKGLIEKIYGNPLINVADGGKILKDMETEVSEGFDEHEIVGNYGRKKYFAGYEKSITKSVSIGDITLKIMRGNTYRNEGDTYRCYFFLNDEKIAKKKLLEKLGGG